MQILQKKRSIIKLENSIQDILLRGKNQDV